MPFPEDRPREFNSAEDVERALESGRVSWHELVRCEEIARHLGLVELRLQVAHRQFEEAPRLCPPQLRRDRSLSASKVVLDSFLKQPSDLTEVRVCYMAARDWLTSGWNRVTRSNINPQEEFAKELKWIADIILLLKQVDEFAATDDEAEDPFSRISKRFRKLDRPDLAVAICDQALDINPDNREVLTSRGAALADLQLFADAEASLRRALALDSDSFHALTSLGRVLRNSDCPREAVAPARRAFELSPDRYSYRLLAALASQLEDDDLFELVRSRSFGGLFSPDDGDDLWIGVLAIEVFTHEGRLDWAEQLVNELFDRSPHGATERRLMGLRNEIHDLRYQQGTLLDEDETQ